jgi:UDP-N-acetylmuramoyl-L-alanyl-D-glutamate--2,6-diaminopimelate ligase
MTVGALLQALDRALPADQRPREAIAGGRTLDVEAKGVTHDSRQASRGWVFVALRGLKADGVAFAPQAVANGAAAVVAERPPEASAEAPWTVVADARVALALLARSPSSPPSSKGIRAGACR